MDSGRLPDSGRGAAMSEGRAGRHRPGRMKILTAVLLCVVSSVVTVVATRVVQGLYPPPLQPIIVTTHKETQRFHLDTLRSDVAPFVYKFEYANYIVASKRGFLGLERVPPVWIYVIAVANLTRTNLDSVEVLLKYSGAPVSVGLQSVQGDLCYYPGSAIPKGQGITYRGKQEKYVASIKEVPSGQARFVVVTVCTEDRPMLSDFDVQVRCNEGSFTKVTPIQWDRIGWTTK
jgi:hypothetical protein